MLFQRKFVEVERAYLVATLAGIGVLTNFEFLATKNGRQIVTGRFQALAVYLRQPCEQVGGAYIQPFATDSVRTIDEDRTERRGHGFPHPELGVVSKAETWRRRGDGKVGASYLQTLEDGNRRVHELDRRTGHRVGLADADVRLQELVQLIRQRGRLGAPGQRQHPKGQSTRDHPL